MSLSLYISIYLSLYLSLSIYICIYTNILATNILINNLWAPQAPPRRRRLTRGTRFLSAVSDHSSLLSLLTRIFLFLNMCFSFLGLLITLGQGCFGPLALKRWTTSALNRWTLRSECPVYAYCCMSMSALLVLKHRSVDLLHPVFIHTCSLSMLTIINSLNKRINNYIYT